MEWIHVLTIIISILVPVLSTLGWVIHRIGTVEKDVAVIKTVLMMRGIMPEGWIANDK